MQGLLQVFDAGHSPRSEESFQPFGESFRRWFCAKRAGNRVRDDVDARRTTLLRLAVETRISGLQIEQGGLDVLARAEPVDPEIDAGAGEAELRETSHFHGVGHAARRAHPEVGENRMAGIQVGDSRGLCLRAELAPGDFIGVGCAPIVGMRQFDI